MKMKTQTMISFNHKVTNRIKIKPQYFNDHQLNLTMGFVKRKENVFR